MKAYINQTVTTSATPSARTSEKKTNKEGAGILRGRQRKVHGAH